MADIAQLAFEIDSSQAARASKNLDGMTKAAERAQRQATATERALANVTKQINLITKATIGFVGALASIRTITHLARVADGYANVQAKLRLVTRDQAELGRVSEKVFALSQRTFSSLDSTATLVSRTTRALQSNGAEASAALASSLRLSETIQKAFAVSGATVQEASNAIIQLSQGLSAGALRGEEYNSVAEQGSRITQALAASLGKTTGELREMAAQGELTAEVIQRALTEQAAAIDAEFAKLPLTIGRSLVNLQNAWSQFIGQADQASGASRAIAESIAGLARNLNQIADAALVVAGVIAAAFAGKALQGIRAYSAAVLQSVAATSAQVEMERLSAAASVQSAQAKAIDLARTLEVVAVARQEVVAKQALAAAEVDRTNRILIATKAMGAQSAALQAQRVATEQLVMAQLRLRGVTNELAQFGQQQVRLQSALAAGATAQVAAQTRVAAAMTTTQRIMAGVTAGAARLGSGLLAMAGGPIGIAVLALGAMYVSMRNTEEQAAAFDGRIKSTTRALEDFARTGTVGDLEALFNPETGTNRAADMIAEITAELRVAQGEAASAKIRMEAIGRGSGADLERARDRVAELTGRLNELTPKMDAARVAFVDFVREALNFGKSQQTIARDMNEWFKSMGETEEKLRTQRIELQNGFAAMLEYTAMQAAGVDSADQLSDAVQRTIAKVAAEKAALDAANAAKRESEKVDKGREKSILKAEKATDRAIKSQQEYETVLIRMRAELSGPIEKAQAEYLATLAEVDDQMASNSITLEQFYETLELVEAGHDAATEAAKRQEKENQSLRSSVDDLLADMQTELDLIMMDEQARSSLVAQMQAEEAMIRAIDAARAAGANISAKRSAEYIKEARALGAVGEEAERVAEILDGLDNKSPITRLLEQIDLMADKFGETSDEVSRLKNQLSIEIVGSLKSATDAMAGLFEEGSEGQRKMQKLSAALAVVQAGLATIDAVRAILSAGQAPPPFGFAAMAAMAGAVAPLLASIGAAMPAFSGGGGPSRSESIQAAQGTGTVLGDPEAQSESIANAIDITADATSELVGINRGMLSALQAMQAGISGAAASIARLEFGDISLGQGAGMSSLFNPLGVSGTIAGRLISSIFGGSQELTDQGIRVQGGAFGSVSSNPNASSYQTIETDGGWFGSDRVSDEFADLSDSANTQIQLILGSIGDAVREAATALGLDADEFNAAIEAFRIEEIRISTMDLTGEEAQQQLAAAFSAIFDGLAAEVVPFIDQFQRVGEGLGETLVRVATGVQVTQEAMLQLGFALDVTDPEQFAQISEGLIGMSGGLEDFISGMQNFVSNFAPEAHQFEVAQNALTRAFEQAGLVLPETRDAMWDLMQSLDATTAEGQEQIATLIRLSSASDSYYTMLERQQDEFQEELAESAAAFREAKLNYMNFVAQFRDPIPEPANMDEVRASITAWADEQIDQANALAIAAGLAGANAIDVANIMARASDQMDEAQARFTASYQDFIDQFAEPIPEPATLEQARMMVEEWVDQQIAEANRLALAAGMVGASQDDIALIIACIWG